MSLPGLHDDPDTCPRCSGRFTCGLADSTRPCPCTHLTLATDTLAALRQRYTGCLCLRCLDELASALAEGVPASTPFNTGPALH